MESYTYLEDKYPFVECATFADEIKSRGWDDQANLHYDNIPFFDNGFETIVPVELQNATWAIVSLE